MKVKIGMSASKTWLLLILLAAAHIVIPSTAQARPESIVIDSPRDGVIVATRSLSTPQGSVHSPSGVYSIELVLQRAQKQDWLCWDGHEWNIQNSTVNADYDDASHRWRWAHNVELPIGAALPDGAYRLQAVALSSNGSILARTQNRFWVQHTAQDLSSGSGATIDLARGGGGFLTTGDLNADGRPDIVTINREGGSTSPASLAVLLGNGDGTFGAPILTSVSQGALEPAVGDFNNDGKMDVVTANNDAYNPNGGLDILLGNGDGAFSSQTNLYISGYLSGAATGDFNGDGNTDIVAGAHGGAVVTLLGRGDGTFNEAQYLADSVSARSVAVADLDGDGRLDIASCSNISDNISTYHGNGDGTFILAQRFSEEGSYSITINDFNGDGRPDLAAARTVSPTLVMLLNSGNGVFSAPVEINSDGSNYLASADFNRDGKADVAQGVSTGASSTIHFGSSQGVTATAIDQEGPPTGPIATADFNGDGLPDLVSSDATLLRVWINGGLPTTFGDITGRIVNPDGSPRSGVRVNLVAGEYIDRLLFPRGLPSIPATSTGADGSYSFTNLSPGKYVIVPAIPGVAFQPTGTVIELPLTNPIATYNFQAALADNVAPEIGIRTPDDLPFSNVLALPSPAGTVRDLASNGTRASGVLSVAYTVYRLRSDAASLRLAPVKRGVEAVLSTRASGFVSATSTLGVQLDNVFFAPVNGQTWAATPEAWARVKAALARDVQARGQSGAYRLVVTAIDNSFNRSEVSSYFSVGNDKLQAPAHLGVLRTLPISAVNGSVIPYTVAVTNTGDTPLLNVRVSQNVNTDKTVLDVASITPRASQINAYGVVWNVGTLAPHATRFLQLKVTAKDNNPLGSNISAGTLSVSSSAGSHSFARDTINVESSIAPVNLVRSIGDAIGNAFNYAFNASLRDQRAKANLNTVRSNSAITRISALDAVQLNNSGVLIIPIGGGQVITAGGANVITSGGANVITSGGGNVITAGGANVITAGGGNVQTILATLISDPARVLTAGGGNVITAGGANVITAGGGNLISNGLASVVTAGGANLIDNVTGQISNTALRSLPNGAGVITSGGANVITSGGANAISLNGAGVITAGGGCYTAGGGNVITAGGGNVITAGGGNVITAGGGNVITAGGGN